MFKVFKSKFRILRLFGDVTSAPRELNTKLPSLGLKRENVTMGIKRF